MAPQQVSLNLLADLFKVGLPKLGGLVLPKDWIDSVDIAGFKALGVLVPRS